MRSAAYGYLCDACHHPASGHGLVAGGDLRRGPYRCAECACEIAQDSPMRGLTETEWRSRFGAPVRG